MESGLPPLCPIPMLPCPVFPCPESLKLRFTVGGTGSTSVSCKLAGALEKNEVKGNVAVYKD